MESMYDSTFMNSSSYTLNGTDNPLTFVSLPLSMRILQAIAYTIEFTLGIILNTFLICLILFSKSLRQRGFAFTVQILITNLVFTILVLSSCAHIARFDEWTLGDSFCQFIAFCHQSLQPQRWLLTAALVIDRALTINRPLKYEKYRTKFVAILSTSAIILGLLIGLLPPMTSLRSCNGFTPGTNTCQILVVIPNCGIYLLSYSAVVFMAGGVLPFTLYIWMFYKAKKASREIAPTQPQTRLSSHRSLTQKQLLTVFLLFWTLLGCTLPFYSSFLLVYLSFLANWPGGYFAGYYSLLLFQPLFYGLVIVDPLTLMWHRDVKQELRKIKQKIKAYLSTHFTT